MTAIIARIAAATPIQNRDLDRLVQESIWEIVTVAAAVVVLIVVAYWLRKRWHGREDHSGLDHTMLTQFGELHRQGDLTEEEYRSIKSRLVERMDESLRTPKPKS